MAEDGNVDAIAQGFDREVERSVTGEQGHGSAAGSGNECFEFIVHRFIEGCAAGIGHMGCAIKKCLLGVVEWAFNVDAFESRFGNAELNGECKRECCAGEYGSGLRPQRFVEQFADINRRDAEHWKLSAAFNPCDFAGTDFLTRVDVIDQRRRCLHGPLFASSDIAFAFVGNGPKRSHCFVDACSRKCEDSRWFAVELSANASSSFFGERVAPHRAKFVNIAHNVGVGDDRCDVSSKSSKSSGRKFYA